MFKAILWVAFGGSLGSVLRFIISKLCLSLTFQFPLGTFLVNFIGSFAIGYFTNKLSTSYWQLFFITGFCGGFTTFSAFSLENIKLLQQHNYSLFFTYSLASLFLAIIAVWLGFKMSS